jgi:uncharacterized protein YbjT (DUF2867 family)
MQHILVTGATGKIGSSLIQRLAAHNVTIRAFIRDTEKAKQFSGKGVELIQGAFEDKRVVRNVVEDIDVLVLITSANPNAVEQAHNMLAAAKEAGVKKIVRISVFKAAADGPTDITRLHGHTDAEIQDSGLTYTILRPLFFMQNLFFIAADSLAKERKLYFGTSDAKLSMIDLRDIIDCAEQSIISDAFDNQIFTLTGPASIGFGDISTRLSNMLGYPIQYVSVPPAIVKQSIRSKGMGDWYAQVMEDLCKAYRENWGNVKTNDVERITGHAPRSIDTFLLELFVPALRNTDRMKMNMDHIAS